VVAFETGKFPEAANGFPQCEDEPGFLASLGARH
jgi:hypothetical protein